jgi:hypothetical protein
MDAEQRLKMHIGQMLSKARIKLTPELEENIEDQFIELFREYRDAPDDSKDEVYAIGEGRILQTLHSALSGNQTRSSTG